MFHDPCVFFCDNLICEQTQEQNTKRQRTEKLIDC